MFLFSVPASAVLRLQSYSKNSIPPNIFARIFQENLITIDNQRVTMIKNLSVINVPIPTSATTPGKVKQKAQSSFPICRKNKISLYFCDY